MIENDGFTMDLPMDLPLKNEKKKNSFRPGALTQSHTRGHQFDDSLATEIHVIHYTVYILNRWIYIYIYTHNVDIQCIFYINICI